MAHTLYTTHHIHRRYWVAFAIPVVLVMASIVWVMMVFGERLPSASIGIGRRWPHPHRTQYPRLNTHGATGSDRQGHSESLTCQGIWAPTGVTDQAPLEHRRVDEAAHLEHGQQQWTELISSSL
jgi:hypothetical protein